MKTSLRNQIEGSISQASLENQNQQGVGVCVYLYISNLYLSICREICFKELADIIAEACNSKIWWAGYQLGV